MNIACNVVTGATMRIDSATNFPAVAGNSSPDAVTKTTPPRGTTATPAADTGFAPTADLTRLLQLVNQIPDVRAEVVQEVLTRAETGELGSPQAAVDTAAAILESNTLDGE
jgi:hypothetical protein